VGAGVHAREASSEAEMDPRARRSPLEGGIDRATPLGRGGRLGVGRAVGVCLSERCVVFYFFAGFKRDSPGCFRGPQGCPRQYHLNVLSMINRKSPSLKIM
jgi:hypothetical protein